MYVIGLALAQTIFLIITGEADLNKCFFHSIIDITHHEFDSSVLLGLVVLTHMLLQFLPVRNVNIFELVSMSTKVTFCFDIL